MLHESVKAMIPIEQKAPPGDSFLEMELPKADIVVNG